MQLIYRVFYCRGIFPIIILPQKPLLNPKIFFFGPNNCKLDLHPAFDQTINSVSVPTIPLYWYQQHVKINTVTETRLKTNNSTNIWLMIHHREYIELVGLRQIKKKQHMFWWFQFMMLKNKKITRDGICYNQCGHNINI